MSIAAYSFQSEGIKLALNRTGVCTSAACLKMSMVQGAVQKKLKVVSGMSLPLQ